jgi:hypothetical protein
MFILYTLSADAAGEDGDTPTDWMLLESITNNGTGESIQQKVYCKIHDGSESSVVITATGAGTGDVHSGRMIAFSGTLDTCTGIVAHTNEQGNSAASNIAHPGLTVSTANTLIIAVGGKRACEACAWSTLSGFTEEFDNVTTSGDDQSFVLDYQIQTTATNISSGSFSASAGDETQISVAILLSIKEAASAPVFTVGPSESPATNGFTISGTITGAGTLTVEAVACNPGDAAPSNAELEAGQCGGGNAALMNASEVWTSGVSNDFLLTSANKPVRFDVYVAGTNGTDDTAVTSLTDQDRSIRSGYLSVVITSHSTTGICNLDSYFTPDCADGDVFEYEDDTNENADCNVTIEADGDVVLTPVSAGDCGGPGDRRTFEISYQDVSIATDGLFTAPTVGNFTTDDTIAVNNSAPYYVGESEDFLFERNASLGSGVDFKPRWEDDDGDTPIVTFQDAPPAGLTMTSGVLTGTPTTCQSLPITERAADSFGDFNEQEIEIDIGFVIPNVVGLTEAAAVSAIEAPCQ